MAAPANPLVAFMQDWNYWRLSKADRIMCASLGKNIDEHIHEEFAKVSPEQLAVATFAIESYDHLFAPPKFAGDIPAYVGPQPPGAPDADTVLHPSVVFPWMVEGMTPAQVVTPPDVKPISVTPPVAVPTFAFCPNCGAKLR